MHIHILGICGTFMGGIAALAQAAGHKVTGQDAHVYPPMSTQLQQLGIELHQGYEPEAIAKLQPDVIIVGNALGRGNPAVEYVLERKLHYTSGPEWLRDHLLRDRWVIAVAGTHGKTTTSSMIAWILEDAGLEPGYLIGGVPQNFEVSARLGAAPFFVVEADEYDTAFFDKRSKFVHYLPNTLVMNNLEFDHADIFDDLAAIERQFHHVVRTVPGNGRVLYPAQSQALQRVMNMGCWSERETLDDDWQYQLLQADGSAFAVRFRGELLGEVYWDLIGLHNVQNGLAAIAAARHAGVRAQDAIVALGRFVNTKRRLELRGEVAGVRVYDDFAHHPTAIATTLQGMRAHVGEQRVLAILEPRSNTMKLGVHQNTLAESLKQADQTFLFQPDTIQWDLQPVADVTHGQVHRELDALVTAILAEAKPGDHLLVMSNGGFGGIHQKLLDGLAQREV